MEKITLNTISEAIEDLRQGKVIIVVDDEDRENEGDFLSAAELTSQYGPERNSIHCICRFIRRWYFYRDFS